MARKPNYKTLESMYQSVSRERDYLSLYLFDRESNVRPIRALLTKDQTEHKDEWFRADWYRSESASEGYVVLTQHYGKAANQHNTWVLGWSQFEAIQYDQDMTNLRSKLQTARFNKADEPPTGVASWLDETEYARLHSITFPKGPTVSLTCLMKLKPKGVTTEAWQKWLER